MNRRIQDTSLLLVEDNPGDALLLRELLETAYPGRYRVTVAPNLEQATEALSKQEFTAVLLDLFLPDSQGLATIQRFVGTAGAIPIVVVTGLADEDLAMDAIHSGAQDYLVKGQADGDVIARAIRHAVDRRAAAVALQRAHDELEQKVKDRTAALTQTIGELQAEAARRSQAEQVLHERSEQLRLLASELTMAEHRERQRLAQVLHDGLQQILVAAKFRLALMGRAADKDRQQAITEVSNLIDDALETSRSLTAELSPPILREFGLIPALEWLARWMQDRHGLSVDLTAHGRIAPAAEDITVLLFQATRELLLNVAKHAGVKSAQVKVTRTKGQIQVEVTDSGAGFNTKQLRIEGGRGGGFGLFSVHERITLLGGKMMINSTPGRGSRITLIVGPPSIIEDSEMGPDERQQKVPFAPEPPFKERAAPERKIRVLVVDDHVVMRQGLARLLQEEPDIEIVGEASDGEEAVNLAREIRPDVVLMDISLPGMNGIQATYIIHAELPEVRVIGLSMFEKGERADAMRQAGAVAYLTKSGPSDGVIAAIRDSVRPTEKNTGTVNRPP